MQAVICERWGEPREVLRVQDALEPVLTSGHVRVRMLASPVNPSDVMTIRGVYGKQPPLPMIPGYEGVGIVEAADAGLIGRFMHGKRVAVLAQDGGNWAERVVVPATQVIPVPAALSVEQAAMFFVNPATAWILSRRILQIPRGGWLLQTAAASAVGRMVIRLGRHEGFRTVNIVRRESQVDELKRLGGDAVIIFDAGRDDPAEFAQRVQDATGGQPILGAIDPVGGATATAALHGLSPGGRLVLYGTLSPEPLSFSPRLLMGRGLRVEGFWLSPYMARQSLLTKLGLIRTLGRLIQAGVLSAEVSATFPLTEVVQAVEASETPGKSGKIVLRIADSV